MRCKFTLSLCAIVATGGFSWGIAQAAWGPNSGSSATPKAVRATTTGTPPTAQTLYAGVSSTGGAGSSGD